MRPDLRNSSPSIRRGGLPCAPVQSCFTDDWAIPQRSPASAVVMMSVKSYFMRVSLLR
nr:MAG TPA: hypothetical protein [Caudoviricetes sp.]